MNGGETKWGKMRESRRTEEQREQEKGRGDRERKSANER